MTQPNPQSAIRNPQSSSPQSAIRVLLVDDSPLVLYTLQQLLSRSPEIQVVGVAANGRKALDLLETLHPDVICTDLHMPVMDGLELIREVMAHYPRPILVVSVSVEPDSPNVFRALEAGAVDIYPKPRNILNGPDFDRISHELASKIRILSGVRVFRKNAFAIPPDSPQLVAMPAKPARLHMVVIGASTGGPQALREILSRLPRQFSLPVVCIQHIGHTFLNEMITWLAETSPMPVCKAMPGETAQAGVVYFAPEDAHLEWDSGGRFMFSKAAPIDGHQPSVTATMNSAARCFGAGVAGVLLTGMGRDGADGMSSIHAAGGMTIAQDEASCVVYGMPREAVAQNAVQRILSLEQIAPALILMADCGVN